MSSNTQPLPAAQLLALADAAVVGTCQKCRRRVKMSSVTHDGGHKTCAGPVVFGPAEKAYRAARAASPVTLEEALLTDEVLTGKELSHRLFYFAAFNYEERLEAEKTHNAATHARIEHARRLAGEGGGQ